MAELRELITQHLADLCGLPAAELDPDRPLQESGLSSRDALVLAGYLEALLERSLPPTLVWEHPTISGLAVALADLDVADPVRAAGAFASPIGHRPRCGPAPAGDRQAR